MLSLLRKQRPAQFLLPLALLLQKMIASSAFDDNLAATSSADTLLSAGVGLLFRHKAGGV